MTLRDFLLVFVGGGLGCSGRHGINLIAARIFGPDYPFGTFAVNLIGAFAIGLVFELLALKVTLPQDARPLLMTGVIGGFTTFSTYLLEISLLYQRGELAAALLYAFGSLACGLVALAAGLMTARWLAA
jgi:CrcB protein